MLEHSWYTPTGLHLHDCCTCPGFDYSVTLIILRDADIMLQPLNKQRSREVGSSATRWFLCYCFSQRHHTMTTINSSTHTWVGNLTTIGSDHGLSPGRHRAIIRTKARILLIGPLWTSLNELLIEIQAFSFKKMRFEKFVCEMASILSRPQCVKRSINCLSMNKKIA